MKEKTNFSILLTGYFVLYGSILDKTNLSMKKIVNTFILENQPMVIDLYKSIFKNIEENNKNFKFNIASAINANKAFEIIQYKPKNTPFDLAILDLRIPSFEQERLFSGEDVAHLLKEKFNLIKIIVVTSFQSPFIISSIFKRFKPYGIIIKGDVDSKELTNAFIKVISNEYYNSKSVVSFLRDEASIPFLLDELDRQILYYLSKGTMIKNLSNHIALSESGIKKRIKQMKIKFEIDLEDGGNLILAAKKYGLI